MTNKDVKCPYCGSTNVDHSALGYVESTATFIGGLVAGSGVGLLTSMLTGGKGVGMRGAAKGVSNNVPTEFTCKRCGKSFHSKHIMW